MKQGFRSIILCLVFTISAAQFLLAADGVIKIGINLPFTGMFELIGKSSKNAAELVRKEIDAAGGIDVNGKKYKVEFLYGDNKSDSTTAVNLTLQQISQDKVLAIVGGLSSRQAIPMGQMAQAFKTPMISPNSSSPTTTLDRPYVFRSCFVLNVQGPAITKFAAKEFNATKAAVLYDIVSAYPRAMAGNFKEAFEAQNGVGSVVAFEEFRTGDEDYSKQLARIKQSGAQIIFVPQHDSEVPLIVQQVKNAGLTIPILGSNSWSGGDLMGKCGADCHGLFFTGNWAPGNATGLNKVFVNKYKAAYNTMPDEPSALTWDAIRVMIEAIKTSGGLTGNVMEDRTLVKNSLARVQRFEGATGELNFNETGNPTKCTVIIKIDNNGVFTSHDSICP